jgi:integrase
MPLTDLAIRALQPPEKGTKIIYDDSLTGFGVRITKNGVASFILTQGRRRHRETIGRVGVLSLKDARAAAKVRLAEYTLGKYRPRQSTWTTAKEEFLKEKQLKRKNTCDAYKRHLTYFPFGDIKLIDITPIELQRDLDKIKKLGEREKTFTVLRVFLNWCHRKNYFDRNPVERIAVPRYAKPRARVLSDDELKQVWQAAGDDSYGRIVKLLILTGQRLREIASLNPEMIGEDRISFPAWLTKNGRGHAIPLPTTVAAIVAFDRNAKGSSLMFPGRGGVAISGFSRLKNAIDKKSGVTNWRIHDLRRTFASGLAALGIQIPVIERLLNHISGTFAGVVGIYNRHDYWLEMKDALAKWDDHLRVITA